LAAVDAENTWLTWYFRGRHGRRGRRGILSDRRKRWWQWRYVGESCW